MHSVTYAIESPIALLIRELVRDTPLAPEWESAVLWDRPSLPPFDAPPVLEPPRLHATVNLSLLERLTEAMYGSDAHVAYAWSHLSRQDVSTYVHRMHISARRRLNVWD